MEYYTTPMMKFTATGDKLCNRCKINPLEVFCSGCGVVCKSCMDTEHDKMLANRLDNAFTTGYAS